MTTLDTMNSKSNLDCIADELVTELTSKTAEVVQGGWNIHAYDGLNGTGGQLHAANFAQPNPKNGWRIDSVTIHSGTWRFYSEPNYGGEVLETLTSGRTYNFRGRLAHLNNRVGSFRKVS